MVTPNMNISILDDLKLFPECKTITNIWIYEKFEEYLHNVVQSSELHHNM